MLGDWLSRVRERRVAGQLPAERAADLDRLGVNWTPPVDRLWEIGLSHATTYRDQHGDLAVPYGHTTSDGHALWRWLDRQRGLRRRGELPADRAAALEELGMIWDPQDQRRQVGLTHLAEYRSQHGDVPVPQRYISPDGFRLGQWYSRNRDTLS